jgi:hypothetical protein
MAAAAAAAGPDTHSGARIGFVGTWISSLSLWLVGLDGGPAGAELLRLAARVFELGASVGVDELAGFDPLEPVTL